MVFSCCWLEWFEIQCLLRIRKIKLHIGAYFFKPLAKYPRLLYNEYNEIKERGYIAIVQKQHFVRWVLRQTHCLIPLAILYKMQIWFCSIAMSSTMLDAFYETASALLKGGAFFVWFTDQKKWEGFRPPCGVKMGMTRSRLAFLQNRF